MQTFGDRRWMRDPTALRLLFLAAFVALVVARAPRLFLSPRLWAEEGAVFLTYAYAHPFWDALLAPLSGYYNLPASLGAALAAALLPIELAPLATLAVSLLFQLTPALVVLTARADGLANEWQRAAILLLLLVALPSHEVWLNTVNSQFHLCAACGLMLAFRPADARAAWAWRVILAAGALSGTASVTLLPLFAIEAWRGGERERAIQAAILTGGAGLQAAVILTGFLHRATAGLADPNRSPPTLDQLAVVVAVKSILAPLAGSKLAGQAAHGLREAPGSGAWWLTAALGLGALAGMALVVRPVAPSLRLLAAFAVVIGVNAFGWLGDKLAMVSNFVGGRYFFAPNLFLGVALLLAFFAGPAGWRRRAVGLLAAAMLVTGTVDFWSSRSHFRGPDWRTEVQRWQKGESEVIAIPPIGFPGVRPPAALRTPP